MATDKRSDPEDVIRRYFDWRGEEGLITERLKELEYGHEESLLEREFLRDQGHAVQVTDKDFENDYLSHREHLQTKLNEIQKQVAYFSSLCAEAGLDPEEYRKIKTDRKNTPDQDFTRGKKGRRGRGHRKNDAFWNEYNEDETKDPFVKRECLFSDANGQLRVSAFADLDTGLKVPGGLIMSSRYAKEIGRSKDVSRDFDDPCLRSISGHLTPVSGILRDVVFRLKGTSVTFKRDFYICDAIDNMVDIMFGAIFIKDQFRLLFERVKSLCSSFAGWFSIKKETVEERLERERRECEQKIKANQIELARLEKERARLETLKRQGLNASTSR